MKPNDEMPTHVLAEYKGKGDSTVLIDMLTSSKVARFLRPTVLAEY